MKKIIEFLKWPGAYPIIILIVLAITYFLWFLFIPMEFSWGNDDSFTTFILGLILLIISALTVTAMIVFKKHWVWIPIFIITIPILLINSIYTLIQFPIIKDKADFAGYEYYLIYVPIEPARATINFYKCKNWNLNCQRIVGYKDWYTYKIFIDRSKDEVSIMNVTYSRLEYTDGKQPRTYVGNTQLENHIYYMSEDCIQMKDQWNCGIYQYDLYECDLDNTSCNRLPFQYTGGDGIAFLKPNNTTNEINIYLEFDDSIQNTWIFTYGPHPRCYVAGCTITDK